MNNNTLHEQEAKRAAFEAQRSQDRGYADMPEKSYLGTLGGGLAGNCCTAERPEREIPSRLSVLRDRICHASERLETLNHRLQPVLRSQPSGKKGQCGPNNGTELGNALADSISGVEHIGELLNEILDTLEL